LIEFTGVRLGGAIEAGQRVGYCARSEPATALLSPTAKVDTERRVLRKPAYGGTNRGYVTWGDEQASFVVTEDAS
jgi:hypothetical protein